VSDDPYRGPLRVPPDAYLVAWEDLRRRRTAMMAATLACIPVSLLATALVGGPASLLVLPAMGAAGIASLRWSTFECPRCGQYFAGRQQPASGPDGWWSHDGRRKRVCSRCGIEEGTPRSACTDPVVMPLPDVPPA
jgi:hypothetical protein